ncbi:MAG: hypothetical protein AVDCRST_MAG34-2404, partial [uncultured Nocardioidaceae bacterium]
DHGRRLPRCCRRARAACAAARPRRRTGCRSRGRARQELRHGGPEVPGQAFAGVPGRQAAPEHLPVQHRGRRRGPRPTPGLRPVEGNDPVHCREPRPRRRPSRHRPPARTGDHGL